MKDFIRVPLAPTAPREGAKKWPKAPISSNVRVVKVQRPVHSDLPGNPWLIYDATRTFEEMVPEAKIPSEVKKNLKGFKGYFLLRYTKDQGWLLTGERVEDQPW